MAVVLDSRIWLAVATGQLTADAVISSAGEQAAFMSVISLGKLHFGVGACTGVTERAKCAAWLQRISSRPLRDVMQDVANAFGVLAASVKRAGRSPRPRCKDLWIAAQAMESGYTLLTLNLADFRDLPGLDAKSPI